MVVSPKDDRSAAMLKEIYSRFIPNKVILRRPVSGTEAEDIVKISPFVENQLMVKGQTTVYVCENRICQLPVTNLLKLKELFNDLSGGSK